APRPPLTPPWGTALSFGITFDTKMLVRDALSRVAARRRRLPIRSSVVLAPTVFKAYDVRGIYPDELDEEGAYAIGRAYVEQFEPRKIAVGWDMRVSSEAMAAAAVRGAAEAGVDVLELGLVGTEMLYFAVGDLGLDGGI